MRTRMFIPGWTPEDGIERFQRHVVAAYRERYGQDPADDQIEVRITVSGLSIYINND